MYEGWCFPPALPGLWLQETVVNMDGMRQVQPALLVPWIQQKTKTNETKKKWTNITLWNQVVCLISCVRTSLITTQNDLWGKSSKWFGYRRWQSRKLRFYSVRFLYWYELILGCIFLHSWAHYIKTNSDINNRIMTPCCRETSWTSVQFLFFPFFLSFPTRLFLFFLQL